MEKIKDLFIKHFGFFPDIISTTEHAYISPPSRIISSLIELSKHKNVLRLAITDSYSAHPEKCVQQICIPHILNKNLFNLSGSLSKTELIQNFQKDVIQVKDMLKDQHIFSKNEINNYVELTGIYEDILNKTQDADPVGIYSVITNEYVNMFGLCGLHI